MNQTPHSPHARNATRAVLPAIFAVAAVLLLAVPSVVASHTPSTARGCGIQIVAEANCVSVTMSMWIEYENCTVWGQNENGIWIGDCPTHWTIYVSATNWVTPGGFSFNWPGWCGGVGAALEVGSHDFSYECRANGPLYAFRCDWSDPEYSITVNTQGVSNPAGVSTPNPGALTVSASAARPQPPGGC